jgi:serine/alanine racemase
VNFLKDRAWIEVDLNNLANNIDKYKKVIPSTSKIIAVVKANAYGHGSKIIAKKLNDIGITDFAVATLEEGIELRESGIKGNILILGYTGIKNLKYVIKYDLIQTIVDYDYSEQIRNMSLKELGGKLKCHVKINTGMNRIGEKYNHIDKLEMIYSNPNLEVLGTFSHFCVADSDKEEDIDFSKKQIDNFNFAINSLKEKGINVGKTHIQASYGTINYNYLNYDYVRLGILMYGVNGDLNEYEKIKLNFKPVLSLMARVTSVKEIEKCESISYGRTYIAKEKRKIASVSIGYADGIPRRLSNEMTVKVNGKYAKVVGRVCMDQLMIDVTDIPDVKTGDIVYIIDKDDSKLSVERLANDTKTITYEIFCNLSERLPRIAI